MLFHFALAVVMLASVAAFVILWYFWVKKRLGAAQLPDSEHQILLPFRHFAWLLIGLIVVTCIVQVHFARVSTSVYEDLDSIASFLQEHRNENVNIREVAQAIKGLRAEMNESFEGLRTLTTAKVQAVPAASAPGSSDVAHGAVANAAPPVASPSSEPTREKAKMLVPPPKRAATPRRAKTLVKPPVEFAKAAEASTSSRPPQEPATKPASAPPRQEQGEDAKAWSMKIDMAGTVTAGTLVVRLHPEHKAPVVEKLRSGDAVSVTEKRMVGDRLWYGIVTPKGAAGWVDFRYLKLKAKQSGPGAATGDA